MLPTINQPHLERHTKKPCMNCRWLKVDRDNTTQGRCTVSRTGMGAVWQRVIRDIRHITCERFEEGNYAELATLVKALTKSGFRQHYLPGQHIFQQGDPGNELFLIKAGRVKLSRLLRDGAEIILDIRKTADLLGVNVFSEGIDYPLTATCIEETLICGITKDKLEKLILDDSRVGLQIIRTLSRRISFLTIQVSSMAATYLEERLYGVLLNVAREHGTMSQTGLNIPFPLTHEDLGFLVGAHRVSISRAMKGLKQSGRIIEKGRLLTVCEDPNLL